MKTPNDRRVSIERRYESDISAEYDVWQHVEDEIQAAMRDAVRECHDAILGPFGKIRGTDQAFLAHVIRARFPECFEAADGE